MNLPHLAFASLAALGLFSVGITATTRPPTQRGQHDFNLRSLRGPHGFSYSGSHQTLGAIASSGRIEFDGDGNVTADYTTSVGGTTFTGFFAGTYSVNADGTGAIVVNLPWLNTQGHGNFVLVDKGDGTFFTSTDPGYSVTGSTRRITNSR